MPDRRFIGDFESLLRFVRRSFLEAAIARQPVLGGVAVTFGNVPDDDVIPGIIIAEVFKGLVALPSSDGSPGGWGFPYDIDGTPIDPPRGTPGGTHPEGIFSIDGNTSDVTYIRSSSWFPAMGSRPMSSIVGGADWQKINNDGVKWNSVDAQSAISLSNSDRTVGSSSTSWASVRAVENAELPTGSLWIYTVNIDFQVATQGTMIGVCDLVLDISPLGVNIGAGENSVGWQSNGDVLNNGFVTTTISSYTQGDSVMVAFNETTGNVWLGKNDVWENSGDPSNGTGAVFTGIVGPVVPAISLENTTNQATGNFIEDDITDTIPDGFIPYGKSALVISYGILGDTRYQENYSEQMFKDTTLLTLSPPPSDLCAVAASDNILYVATSNSNIFKIIKYTMEDSSLLVQDLITPVVELISYDLDDLRSDDTVTSVQPTLVHAANFSPNADACVFTTTVGDLVEFSVSPTSVIISDEQKFRLGLDDRYDNANFSNPGGSDVTVVTADCITEETFPGSGVFNRYQINAVETRTLVNPGGTLLTGSFRPLYILSDYDQLTNQRVDLKLEVTQADRTSGSGIIDTRTYTGIRVFIGTCSDEETCCDGFVPFWFPSMNGDFIQIADERTTADCGTIELKLGSTTLETFHGDYLLSNATHRELSGGVEISNFNVFSAVRTNSRLREIFAADLRTGFIAYHFSVGTETQTVFGGPVTNAQTGTYKVAGGRLLPDDSASTSEAYTFTDYCDVGNGVTTVLSYFFDPVLEAYTQNLPGNLKNKVSFEHRNDMMLAEVDMPLTSPELEYKEFTEGDAATIAETTGTNPIVTPKGVI